MSPDDSNVQPSLWTNQYQAHLFGTSKQRTELVIKSDIIPLLTELKI